MDAEDAWRSLTSAPFQPYPWASAVFIDELDGLGKLYGYALYVLVAYPCIMVQLCIYFSKVENREEYFNRKQSCTNIGCKVPLAAFSFRLAAISIGFVSKFAVCPNHAPDP
jgi:hypothetical protein